jgi:hypothetical protein
MSETPRTDEIVRECGGVTAAWARKLETELTAVRLELKKAKAVRNDRERRRSKAEAENRRLTAMLDRIARVVSDRFDPKSEECIADGVDSLVDELATLKKERDEARVRLDASRNAGREAVDSRDRVIAQLAALQKAVRLTLDENAHLADGENCTLIRLKNALTPTPPQEQVSLVYPFENWQNTPPGTHLVSLTSDQIAEIAHGHKLVTQAMTQEQVCESARRMQANPARNDWHMKKHNEDDTCVCGKPPCVPVVCEWVRESDDFACGCGGKSYRLIAPDFCPMCGKPVRVKGGGM